MGRFRNSAPDEGSEGGIDMSPMIDCVFILLIFFIVTTTFVDDNVTPSTARPVTPVNKTSNQQQHHNAE